MEFLLFSDDGLVTCQFYSVWLGEVDSKMSVPLATGFLE